MFCTANFITSFIIKSFVLRMSKNFLGLINIDVTIIFKGREGSKGASGVPGGGGADGSKGQAGDRVNFTCYQQ